MRHLIWLFVAIAVAVGLYVQELGGDVERLPASLQPGVRKVEATLSSAVGSLSALLPASIRKAKSARAPDPAAAAAGAPKKAPAQRERPAGPIIIDYRDDRDLLGQLQCVPVGQRLLFRRIVQNGAAPAPSARCESGRCPLSETREQRDMRRKIDVELARISGRAPRP